MVRDLPKRSLLFLAGVLAAPAAGTSPCVHFVSPTGSAAGTGAADRPWDLATALAGAGGRVHPGDTVWLGGGTYRGAFGTQLRGAPLGTRMVQLEWTDNSNAELGFVIERRVTSGSGYSRVGMVGPDQTSFIDTAGLAPSSSYTYRVAARGQFIQTNQRNRLSNGCHNKNKIGFPAVKSITPRSRHGRRMAVGFKHGKVRRLTGR